MRKRSPTRLSPSRLPNTRNSSPSRPKPRPRRNPRRNEPEFVETQETAEAQDEPGHSVASELPDTVPVVASSPDDGHAADDLEEELVAQSSRPEDKPMPAASPSGNCRNGTIRFPPWLTARPSGPRLRSDVAITEEIPDLSDYEPAETVMPPRADAGGKGQEAGEPSHSWAWDDSDPFTQSPAPVAAESTEPAISDWSWPVEKSAVDRTADSLLPAAGATLTNSSNTAALQRPPVLLRPFSRAGKPRERGGGLSATVQAGFLSRRAEALVRQSQGRSAIVAAAPYRRRRRGLCLLAKPGRGQFLGCGCDGGPDCAGAGQKTPEATAGRGSQGRRNAADEHAAETPAGTDVASLDSTAANSRSACRRMAPKSIRGQRPFRQGKLPPRKASRLRPRRRQARRRTWRKQCPLARPQTPSPPSRCPGSRPPPIRRHSRCLPAPRRCSSTRSGSASPRRRRSRAMSPGR